MKYANLQWREGQPYSPDFDDVYFSVDNGIEETEHVFIHHNRLQPRFEQNTQGIFTIAETGFGSGLNFLIAVKHWLQMSEPWQTLYFYSVESTPLTPEDLIRAHNSWPELKDIAKPLQQQYNVASYGYHQFELYQGRVKLVLMLGEVDAMLAQLQAPVDAWFLDGFAPGCNPDMWSERVFSHIQRLSRPATTLSTYTAAGFVRRGLIEKGFAIEKVSGIGKKRHMLAGTLTSSSADINRSDQPWYENAPRNTAMETSREASREATRDATRDTPRPINKNKAVSIIGAGIAGISSAWALVKRGYQVEIFEAGEALGMAAPGNSASGSPTMGNLAKDNSASGNPASGNPASGNPRGMIMPRLSLQDSADAEFYTSAYFYALRCLHDLDPQQQCWQQTGGLQLPSSERSRKQMANYPQDASLAQTLDAQAASEICGLNIEETVHYFALAACVFPQQVLQKMIDEMGDALKINYQTSIESLDYVDGHWELKNQHNDIVGKIHSLILANAWQLKKYSQLAHVDLQPARGQLSYYRANQRSKKLKMPVSFEGYIMPEHNHQHISGASFVMDDCSTHLRDEEADANLREINHWFNHLFAEKDNCGGRAAVRAVTPDRVPIVGHVALRSALLSDYGDLNKGKPACKYPVAKNLPGLFVNSGYGARGFSSAFLCSELLAAIISDEPLPVSKRVRYALHSSRFLIRSLKKRRFNEK